MHQARTFRVTVRPYQASFDCRADETLLAGARACGLALFSNCERGECGTCKVRVRKGRVRLAPFMFSALSISEIDADYTLACRSYPLSDVEITAELVGWLESRHYARRTEDADHRGESQA